MPNKSLDSRVAQQGLVLLLLRPSHAVCRGTLGRARAGSTLPIPSLLFSLPLQFLVSHQELGVAQPKEVTLVSSIINWSRKRLLLEGVGACPECFEQGRDRRTASLPHGCVSLQRVSQLENPCPGLWSEFSSGSSFICVENEDVGFSAALWSQYLGRNFLLPVIYPPKKTPFRRPFPHTLPPDHLTSPSALKSRPKHLGFLMSTRAGKW